MQLECLRTDFEIFLSENEHNQRWKVELNWWISNSGCCRNYGLYSYTCITFSVYAVYTYVCNILQCFLRLNTPYPAAFIMLFLLHTYISQIFCSFIRYCYSFILETVCITSKFDLQISYVLHLMFDCSTQVLRTRQVIVMLKESLLCFFF